MSKEKVLYRTVIEIEVLSEEPIDENWSIEDIEEECNSGSFSGVHDWKVKNQEVRGLEAVKLTQAQGSSIDFFGMDENGNDINEDEDDE